MDTGFAKGINLANVVLVGARDLDPAERIRIDIGQISLVPAGPALAQRLYQAIDGGRVYVHRDCDVLDPGLLATEYQSPDGLSFRDLYETFEVLAKHHVVGLEITEFEATWPDGPANHAGDLIQAIQPVMDALRIR